MQRDESRRRINAWVNELWTRLAPAVDKNRFNAWNLSNARRKMLEDQGKNQKLYTFRDTRLEDSFHNRLSFEPYATQGNLFASTETKKAIDDVLAAEQSSCTHLSVSWLPTKDETIKKEYRTLLGDRELNEVIYPAQSSAMEVDYVTDKLRYFSR